MTVARDSARARSWNDDDDCSSPEALLVVVDDSDSVSRSTTRLNLVNPIYDQAYRDSRSEVVSELTTWRSTYAFRSSVGVGGGLGNDRTIPRKISASASDGQVTLDTPSHTCHFCFNYELQHGMHPSIEIIFHRLILQIVIINNDIVGIIRNLLVENFQTSTCNRRRC